MCLRYIRVIFLMMISTLLLCRCGVSEKFQLQTGDLLFRGKTTSNLSVAIDDVTQTGNNHHFSHIGLVEVVNNEIMVIHSEGAKGVCSESLDVFLKDENLENQNVEAFRLKPEYQKAVLPAIERAGKLLGEPYNFTYIIEDPGYYCSELIWYVFAPDSVFSLEPMTFKDQETGDFHPMWVKHYQFLGIDIPEGLPGCNPNGMAASDEIVRLGIVDWVENL
jgi:hypothetical protein